MKLTGPDDGKKMERKKESKMEIYDIGERAWAESGLLNNQGE